MGDAPDRGPGIQLVDNPFAGQAPIAGRFQVSSEIGGGPLGRAYLAHDEAGARVVVKVVPGRLSARVEDPLGLDALALAARQAAALDHPGVVRVLAWTTVDAAGTPAVAVVSEHVHAPTLGSLVGGGVGLPAERAVDLVDQVAVAVEHAHQRGVLHLDLHPGNVFVEPGDRVRVADFALRGAFAEDPGAGPEATVWCAPELRAGGIVDESADVWSLGLLLQHLLTGRAPQVPPLGHVLPNDLHRVVEKAVREEPVARFHDVASFREALRDPILERTPPPAEPLLATHPAPAPLRDLADPRPVGRLAPPVYLILPAALAAILLASCGLLWWAPWADGEAPAPPAARAVP